MLQHNKGLEAKIAARLEAAGSHVKAAEWLLLQMAILLVAGVLGLVIGNGSIIVGLLFLLRGLVAAVGLARLPQAQAATRPSTRPCPTPSS